MRYNFLKISFLTLFFVQSFLLKAQVSLTASMDTNMLLIGDQTKFTLEANVPKGYQVNFPLFTDTLINKLEIVEILPIDTIIENESWKIKHQYLVTSFDSGWYAIPPFPLSFVNDKGVSLRDTLWTKPLYFGVVTMPLDTTNTDAIADIKKQAEAPITFREIMPFLLIAMGSLLFLILAWLVYKKWIRKEKIFVKKEKPKDPAHIIAFKSLDALKQEKLWEKGQNKAFYSALTDIIRTYIYDRYGMGAMEMTTDEIQNEFFNNKLIDKELVKELYAILVNADFVKFAKATTLSVENENALKFAYDFVIKTKEEEEKEDDKKENTIQETI